MRDAEAPSVRSRPEPTRTGSPTRALTFGGDPAFQQALRQRVAAYFATTGQRPRDSWQMYAKTAILLAAFAGLYALLVFGARTWVEGVPLAILLGLSAAGIGLNVQHDGGHRAYSSSPWVNRLMAMTLELIGGSSYLWRWKHGVFHHTYVNVTGHDTDIELGYLARLAPQQQRLAFHRWQHLYLWPLYGLLTIKWQCLDDFWKLLHGRIHEHRVPRPTGWELVVFIAGKALFFTLAFGIPMLFHSPGVVLGYYVLTGIVMGFLLSVVFQVAHCVEEAEFPAPLPSTGRLDRAWAVHQAETSVDFSRESRLVSWLVGGLNFQIEHHLFPRISHVHYPAIAGVVEQTCREFGIRYTAHPSFWAGIRSHFRWLRRMGMPDTIGPLRAGGDRSGPALEDRPSPHRRRSAGERVGVLSQSMELGPVNLPGQNAGSSAETA